MKTEAMTKVHNPAEIAPPVGAYSHAIEVPTGARTLHIAGQVGITPDGTGEPRRLGRGRRNPMGRDMTVRIVRPSVRR